jgi:CBS domain-containing protein
MHGDAVVGLLSRSRLVRAMLTEGPEGYVAGAMDREFIRLSPDIPLTEVLPKVSGSGACALVMDQEDRLLGIVTSENVSEFLLLRQVSMMQAREH